MGEIRIVGPGETCGYPYPVCKKLIVTKTASWASRLRESLPLPLIHSPGIGTDHSLYIILFFLFFFFIQTYEHSYFDNLSIV